MVRVLQSIAIGALLVIANAVQARADGAQEDTQLNAAVAVENDKGDFHALEKLVLRTTRGRAIREHGRLTLFLGDGDEVTFEDQECRVAQNIAWVCVGNYLLADLPGHRAFVVLAGPDLLIVDDRTGRKTILPAVPQFGPDGREFITLANRTSYSMAIWQWRDGGAQAVWHHGLDLDPIYHETALVRWADSDAIQLDLWCASGPHWPATILRGSDRWRLTVTWPEVNPRACGNPQP